MSIAAHSLSEAPVGAQPPGRNSKPIATRAPANRSAVAKSDVVAPPEPR